MVWQVEFGEGLDKGLLDKHAANSRSAVLMMPCKAARIPTGADKNRAGQILSVRILRALRSQAGSRKGVVALTPSASPGREPTYFEFHADLGERAVNATSFAGRRL